MAKVNKRDIPVGDPEEIDRIMGQEFNPVKEETEKLPESNIKKTLLYDRSRLEFLRMQLGPVKNFFQTLDNVIFSMSERLGVLESELLKLKVLEQLRQDYNAYCYEQGRLVSNDEFLNHLRLKEEKQDESKKS